MELLKLKTNVPETIALAFADGKATTSQFGGDQVYFTLVDGRGWYVAPFVAQKIAEAGIGARQLFTICKQETAQGNRRVVKYQIGGQAPMETAASSAAVSLPSSSNPTSLPQTTAAPAASTPVPTPTSYNGNAARAIHAVPAPAADSSAVALMKMAGFGAIEVVLEVENYARSKGMVDFALDPGSIQDLISSLFIEMCKRGGRA